MRDAVAEHSADRPFEACLFGAALNVGNLGCRALAVSLVKLIADSHPGARISLLIGLRAPETREVRLGSRTVQVDMVNNRLSFRSRPREHLLVIFQA